MQKGATAAFEQHEYDWVARQEAYWAQDRNSAPHRGERRRTRQHDAVFAGMEAGKKFGTIARTYAVASIAPEATALVPSARSRKKSCVQPPVIAVLSSHSAIEALRLGADGLSRQAISADRETGLEQRPDGAEDSIGWREAGFIETLVPAAYFGMGRIGSVPPSDDGASAPTR